MTRSPAAVTAGAAGRLPVELGRWIGWARSLVRDPGYRRLRWVLLIGLLARFVLAPLTSWTVDTDGFVLGDLQLLYTGDPYTSGLFFNPPFGPVLEAPFVVLALLLSGGQPLLVLVATIGPATSVTGISPLLPTAAALLAVKVPLFAGDVAVALTLRWISLPRYGARNADLLAAVWLLNPLVLWVSAVHGEADTFAALFMILALAAGAQRRFVPAGVLLALGVFTKAYPLVLLPLLAVLAWQSTARGSGGWERAKPLGRLAFGLGIGSLPFLAWVAPMVSVLTASGGSVSYGGLSPLIIYNVAVPKAFGSLAFLQGVGLAPYLLDTFRGMAIVAVAGAPLLLWRWQDRGGRAGGADGMAMLATLAVWPVVGVLLSDSVPESENMVGLLALLLVALPVLGRHGAAAYGLISSAAFALYMTLLSPAAFFYPAAAYVGPGAVAWVNGIVIGYVRGQGIVSQGFTWLLCGLVGGGTLLVLWVLSALRAFARQSGRAEDGGSG